MAAPWRRKIGQNRDFVDGLQENEEEDAKKNYTDRFLVWKSYILATFIWRPEVPFKSLLFLNLVSDFYHSNIILKPWLSGAWL